MVQRLRCGIKIILYMNCVFLMLNTLSYCLQYIHALSNLDIIKRIKVSSLSRLTKPRDFRKPLNLRWRLVDVSGEQGSFSGWAKDGILYELPAYNVSILSAVGRNRTRGSGWDEIILNGWEGRTHANATYDCCIHFTNGVVYQVRVSGKNHWLKCKWVHYTAVQFTCPNLRNNSCTVPVGVSLVPSNVTCSTMETTLLPVTLIARQPEGSVALCAKVAYGSVSAYRLLEWYEVQKLMGVSKVVTFTYNLTTDAMLVLKHYQQEGLVDLRPFDYPHKDRLPRSVGQKNQHAFNDEQVVAFDCTERLAGYNFVGLIDHDEFVVPTPTGITKWKNLFNILLRRKPNSSGFWFRTELFISNWRKDANISRHMSVANYSFRTRPMWDRSKSIYIPDRVEPGSIWTHNYTDRRGFERFMVRSGHGTIKHFRTCRQQWVDKNACFRLRQYADTRLVQYTGRIEASINELMKALLRRNRSV